MNICIISTWNSPMWLISITLDEQVLMLGVESSKYCKGMATYLILLTQRKGTKSIKKFTYME